ncbi:MAG TPA: DUF348 domain-containing protein [Clostridiaceae bacterium]|nr:DUF348 domain-containing protein [Clostridiaceae bacterium]
MQYHTKVAKNRNKSKRNNLENRNIATKHSLYSGYIKKTLLLLARATLILLFIITVSFATVYAGARIMKLEPIRQVVLYDGDSVIIFNSSRSATVGDFLRNNNILLRKQDLVYPSRETELKPYEKNEIYIKRATPVKVFVDGKELQIYTQGKTVKEVLANNNIILGPKDQIVDLNRDTPVYPNMNIKIIRVKEEIIKEQETIAFKTVKRANQHLEQGVERVIKEGKEGIKEYSYKVVYKDGEIVSRELIQEKIISEPQDQVIEYGTIASLVTSRGEKIRYKQVLNMRATAYTSSYKDTGKTPDHPHFGITYTGMKAKRGVIAVDPRVIPLGTRVYVECLGNTPDYGYAIAADIGSAVKGDLIDVYVDTQQEADSWGIKKVRVYILAD